MCWVSSKYTQQFISIMFTRLFQGFPLWPWASKSNAFVLSLRGRKQLFTLNHVHKVKLWHTQTLTDWRTLKPRQRYYFPSAMHCEGIIEECNKSIKLLYKCTVLYKKCTRRKLQTLYCTCVPFLTYFQKLYLTVDRRTLPKIKVDIFFQSYTKWDVFQRTSTSTQNKSTCVTW